jgi:uncharacterized protein (DUF58 family)
VQRAEATVTAKGIDVKAVWAKAGGAEHQGRVSMAGRLDPRGEIRVEWGLKPARRGRLRVELASVGSLFPFGFLRKDIGTDVAVETVVWPAPVDYRRHEVLTTRRAAGGERMARAGTGGDLRALRRYAAGDSHRLIHWKASARTRTLLVRQFAAESAESYAIWLRTDAEVWTRPEQFEVAVSLAATLAEDLFRGGRLREFALDAEPPRPVRRVHDLERVLDRLAEARPREVAAGAGIAAATSRQHVLTFAPDGARGVIATLDGQVAASV